MHLCRKWKAYNRIIVVEEAPEGLHKPSNQSKAETSQDRVNKDEESFHSGDLGKTSLVKTNFKKVTRTGFDNRAY